MDASSGMGMVGAIVWMVVLFGIMYFLMLRPQKKEQKRLQAMLNDMEVGDSIVTTGGGSAFFIIKCPEKNTFIFFHFNRLKSVGKCVIIITITQLEYFWRKLLWIIRLH